MKVALIVQRYGTEVVGGSESLARQYALFLKDWCEVEILTSCALEHMTWANHYPPGVTEVEGVAVRRFPTDFERCPYWGGLYQMLKGPMDERSFPGSSLEKEAHARRMAGWPRALQEETVRWQGPYSSELLDYLSDHQAAYDVFFFCTFLFPTSYLGMQRVPREKIVFCPTLHDEPMAYLPIFRQMFRWPRFIIYLTEAERSLARRLYGVTSPGDVIGMALARPQSMGLLPPATPQDYLLYAGRIEPSKGTDVLLEYFLAYKERYPSDLKLVLIGTASARMRRHTDVVYLGFVDEARKLALMQHARAFLHPSPFESFSIVLLESFLMGTPALVNGHSEVLMEHCRQSGAGSGFTSQEEFVMSLHHLLTDNSRRCRMGERGRRYVEERFLAENVTRKLCRALESVCRVCTTSRQ